MQADTPQPHPQIVEQAYRGGAGRGGALRRSAIPPLLLLVGCLLLLGLGRAGPLGTGTGEIVLDDFATRRLHPDGSLNWQVAGRKAVIRGHTAELLDLTVLMSPRPGADLLTVTSPHCRYDQATNTVRSESRVEVEGSDMTIRGVGYEVLPEEQLVTIRSRVHMTVLQVESMPLDQLLLTPADSGTPDRQPWSWARPCS
jgi:hypothetical protein